MEQYLAGLGVWVQGAIFVACVVFLRRGILGELTGRYQSRLRPPAARAQGEPNGP